MSKVYYSAMRKKPIDDVNRSYENGSVVYGYLILLLGIALLMIGYIWEYHQVLDLSEQLRQSKQNVVVLKEKNHTMQVEIAALSIRPRIQQIASKKLNLKHPPIRDVVWYENPTDRFRSFEDDHHFLVNAEVIKQFFSIDAVEARSSQ